MNAGELNELLVELGLDLTEVIAELVGRADPVPIRCALPISNRAMDKWL
jgi:hypothetical protein